MGKNSQKMTLVVRVVPVNKIARLDDGMELDKMQLFTKWALLC
jgi:hypothetical protein